MGNWMGLMYYLVSGRLRLQQLRILIADLFIFDLANTVQDNGQNIPLWCLLIITFLCAELFFLLARNSDIIKVLKKDNQRTEQEKLQVKQGLRRALFSEAFLFLPASIILFRLTVFYLIADRLLDSKPCIVFWYAAMGIAAYGFPFEALRSFVKIVALKSIKEFSEVLARADAQKATNRKEKS